MFFYSEFWGLVSSEVMATLEEFQHGTRDMAKINKSHLFLLPKHQGADRVENFRPISLPTQSAFYMEGPFQSVIGELVGPFQSAFILGRLLVDSAVMAGEIIASWRRNRTRGFIWKVDFAKAYDSLDWNFLRSPMKRRGFPEEWIKWVKRCVTTYAFSILVNRVPEGGRIHRQKGVRQGCPLAPLLFVFTVDALATCTMQACSQGLLKGYQTPSYPDGIPLLQYDDNTMFYIENSVEGARNLSILLDLFTDFSGLQINHTKSTLIGFGLM